MIATAGLGLASVVLLVIALVSVGTAIVGSKAHDNEEPGLVVYLAAIAVVSGILGIAAARALVLRVL